MPVPKLPNSDPQAITEREVVSDVTADVRNQNVSTLQLVLRDRQSAGGRTDLETFSGALVVAVVAPDGSTLGWLQLGVTGLDVSPSIQSATVSATTLNVNGRQVSLGAADSGGAGYRLLRVPN